MGAYGHRPLAVIAVCTHILAGCSITQGSGGGWFTQQTPWLVKKAPSHKSSIPTPWIRILHFPENVRMKPPEPPEKPSPQTSSRPLFCCPRPRQCEAGPRSDLREPSTSLACGGADAGGCGPDPSLPRYLEAARPWGRYTMWEEETEGFKLICQRGVDPRCGCAREASPGRRVPGRRIPAAGTGVGTGSRASCVTPIYTEDAPSNRDE